MYNTTHESRRRDFLIMEFLISKGVNKEELISVSRVRGLLCIIAMSDIVTVYGIHLEEFAPVRSVSREHASKKKFPREAPT